MRKLTESRAFLKSSLVAALAMAAACTGEVGPSSTGQPSAPAGGGTNTPGGAPAGNAGGGNPAAGVGNPMVPGAVQPTTPGQTPAGNATPTVASVGIGAVKPTTTLDSGRVELRRLNTAEYNNTVRDLLGTALTPGDRFPGGNIVDGFDNVGSALVTSDVLLEQAELAAGQLVDELMARPKTDPLRTRILLCEPTAANLSTCMTQILTPLLKNAYRRPVTSAEIQDLVGLAMAVSTSSADPLRGANAALKAVLLSPYFLFHVEIGNPTSPAAAKVNDHELASRLSYFIWSSMPDAALMAAADGGKLVAAGADYTAQVTRMLADAKAKAFVDNFAGQWLTLRDVTGVSPDATVFKGVDDALLKSIATETSTFFQALVKENKPLTELLLADYSYVNARLAKHYGLPSGGTEVFAKVSLAGTQRMGLLTQESFLTVTSYPDRTSPVKRGNWVLDQLLCSPTPAPPPNVPQFNTPAIDSGVTVRAELEMHRANPACATCHNEIDPMGLPFENYDGVGAYRTMDNGKPVDSTATLADGKTKVNGAIELAKMIAADGRFTRCVVKHALTFAVGRSFEAEDAKSYAAGMADPMKDKATWPELIMKVATSEAFLTRRGEAP